MNKTVYPFGTNGSLPSGISIVNDLTTGGATAALSAEQGKVLGDAISGYASVTFSKSDYEVVGGILFNGIFYNAGNYGTKNSYVLIPLSSYRGRVLNFTVVPSHTYNHIAFLQSNSLTNGVAAPYCSGTSSITIGGQYIVPQDCAYLYVYAEREGADSFPNLSLSSTEPTICSTTMADNTHKYGVKWSVGDFNDLGTRTYSAIYKSARIGIGNNDGFSDFDDIYPWSEMKRCNISTNANGAKIVTFEGETGFALDGTNGDVFVRIPKFKTNHYIEDGYEHVVIGDGYTHPAFIENGEELDEIFIGAFEASVVSDAMYSKSGVIPANNMIGAEFLAAAQERGTNYSLYDMRCVDAVWRLMAVEYGCRNSNRILGYGYADYMQPNESYTELTATVAATNSNTITVGKPSSNSSRLRYLSNFAEGNNITICDTNQLTIVAQRKVTDVQCASTSDNFVITFDGSPLNITTSMFVGNAASDCNFCETIGASYKLNWHTGRANRPAAGGWTGMDIETINPCRYRWIENPVGNVWHYLPDVKFNDLQMYVCKDMANYTMTESLTNYTPIGAVLTQQSSNGNKNDVNSASTPNYWITSLPLDVFAKGNVFGKTFDTVHDSSILSTNGYGGYYYLNDGFSMIVNGGGFDHLFRCNILTNRAQIGITGKWHLYGARLMFKNLD